MNILFVCTGNTCRSPMAEGYLKSKNINGLQVDSCGLGEEGLPVSLNSALAMKEAGINIESHLSKTVTASKIDWADKIICLANSHKEMLSSVLGENPKLSVLGGGVPDPFGGNLETYRLCRDKIFSALDTLIKNGEFSEFEIIQAGEEHFKAIANLEKECFSKPWSEEGLLESYRHGTYFFVAKKNGEVLGYIGINTVLDEGYITNVAVFKAHRKKGVGTALLNKVFQLAKEKELSFVSLEVRQSNQNAISLYEKTGFSKEGKRRNFYDNPKEDALILTKRF